MLRSQPLFLDGKSTLQQGLDLLINGVLLREVRALWGVRVLRLYQLFAGDGRLQVLEFDLVMEVVLLREVRALWGVREFRLHQLFTSAGFLIEGLDLIMEVLLLREVRALWGIRVLRL